jgi:lysine-N-methylase
MILRVPEYYEEFSCIAGSCKDSCCAGWEIDIDDDSYAYYCTREGSFGDRLRESMYEDEEGGHRFRLKGPKRCAMLNENNLCDLYTALGEEALCEVCTEYPRFCLYYGEVEQKGLSLSCEEAGRILFSRTAPDRFVDHVMQEMYDAQDPSASEMDTAEDGDAGAALSAADEPEEDLAYIEFLEWAQSEAIALLQDRTASIEERMRGFLAWCESVQDAINHYRAKEEPEVLTAWRQAHTAAYTADHKPARALYYADFAERLETFSQMEELDDEWINTKKEFAALFREDTYRKLTLSYLSSPDYSALGYEHLLVYFVFRYMMNAAYDYDILTYGKLVIVSTLVVRDMDVARYCRNGGSFSLFDRIDIARIFSKEVEHSEGNAEDLKEMCMMEEIASAEALYRQI